MRRYLIVGGIISFFTLISVYAQTNQATQSQYDFKHLTVDQGLAHNRVNSICQDAKGFIWFVTENGLSKFDGQSIVNYKHDPNNSFSLSSDQVNVGFLDSKGNLWFGSANGLDRYDYNKDRFIRFSHKDVNWSIGNVEAVAEDQEGKLWIGAQSGLYAYDLKTSEISYLSNATGNPLGIPSVLIYKLLVDQSNNIWISPYREGLGVYNQLTKSFKLYSHDADDPSTLSGNQIERLYEDKEGNIWAGTMDDGINKFVSTSESFNRIIPDTINSYSTRVRAIFEDLKGNFFVGTRGGLYVRNKQSKTFIPYAYEGHNFSNLSQNSIRCSFIDNSGTLWIGTHSGGVNYTDLHKKGFIHYRAGKDDIQFLNGSSIYALMEDGNGNLWIGGDNGLNFLDRTSHTFRYFVNNPEDTNTLSYNDVKALERDKLGNLWIGTNNGGLNYLDVQTGQFKAYKHDPNDPNSLAGNKIYGLLNDISNRLWIITNANEGNNHLNVDVLPDGSDRFIHLNEGANYGFDQDQNGNVFIGGINGFWTFSGADSIFKFIANELLIGSVNTLKEDSDERIWIGSEKGLVRYDPIGHGFIRIPEVEGEVFGILEDDSKNLWVSSDIGLFRITGIVRDVNEYKVRVFDSDDGLQSKQFNYNAYYKAKSGEMMFGGINGFNTFFPNEIQNNPVPPEVVITDLKMFNKTAPIGKKVNGRLILSQSISNTKEIRLGGKQNIFTLEFAALHFADPEKNIFRYKLEGFHDEWQYRKAGNNFASFSNLPPGEYMFKLEAANPDGIWTEKPVELKIIIVPPFWKTWWFISLVVAAILGIIWTLWRMREKSLKADKERLENELRKEKKEIEKQKEEIQSHVAAIQEKEEQTAKTLWYNQGIVKFSDLISNNKDNIKDLTQTVLQNLIAYVELEQGGIFLLNDNQDANEEHILVLTASYSYSKEKLENKRYFSGEGLIGTCFKNREVIRIDNLPENYSYLGSGLGKSAPKYLVLVPVMLGDYNIGVLELISFNPIEDYKVEFLAKITESLASVVSIVRANEQAMLAVSTANEQKEELLAQEEEIRQNMEEMQATQEELLRKQDAFLVETAMLETLLNFLPDRVTIKDTNGTYIRVNKTKLEALKLKDMDDVKGLTDADFFGDEHFKKALKAERKLMESDKPILENEEQLRFNDGTVQWGSTSRIPFKNSQGEMVGTLTITKNISNQKIIEGKLDSLTELLKDYAETHSVICYETDHKGTINQILGQGLELMGFVVDELDSVAIFTVFEELKKQVDFTKLKAQYTIGYKQLTKDRTLQINHKIILNPSTGGLVGCAEVIEQLN